MKKIIRKIKSLFKKKERSEDRPYLLYDAEFDSWFLIDPHAIIRVSEPKIDGVKYFCKKHEF